MWACPTQSSFPWYCRDCDRYMIITLTFPAACICTGSWGEARSPGAGCRAWGCIGRREDCREQSQNPRQPGVPHSKALPPDLPSSTLTESEKPVCWLACSICFCRDRAPPGWRKPRWETRVCEVSREWGRELVGPGPLNGGLPPVWVGWKWLCTA